MPGGDLARLSRAWRPDAYVASDLVQKRLGEHQDVVWTLTELRQSHLEHTEPVVQVLA